MARTDMRRLSSAIFGNDKLAEVVEALDRFDRPSVTAQEIAHSIRVNHDLVKKALDRLEKADLVKPGERIGGPRGALPYAVNRGEIWDALAALATAIGSSGTGKYEAS